MNEHLGAQRFDYQTHGQRLVIRLYKVVLAIPTLLAIFILVFAPEWAKLMSLPLFGLAWLVVHLIRTETSKLKGAWVMLFPDRVEANMGSGKVKSLRFNEISEIRPIISGVGPIGMVLSSPNGDWIEIGQRIRGFDELKEILSRETGLRLF